MAMGKRSRHQQDTFWVAASAAVSTAAHVFYEKVNELLVGYEFDAFVEKLCAKFYAEKMDRPSVPPGVYFRMLLIRVHGTIEVESGKKLVA